MFFNDKNTAMDNWHIRQLSNIIFSPSREKMYGLMYLYVKEWFLLKQWKQGNTLFSEPKRPLELGAFFFI